mgnify:CR=1 FL=1
MLFCAIRLHSSNKQAIGYIMYMGKWNYSLQGINVQVKCKYYMYDKADNVRSVRVGKPTNM